MAVFVASLVAGPALADGALDQQLLDAAKAGTARQVDALLQQGANIEAQSTGGRTAVCAAAAANNVDVVAALLDKNANANAADKNGVTPLMATASVPVAKLLVAHGANVNARNNYGMTALMLEGTRYSKQPSLQVDMAAFLVANGADINATSTDGDTALWDAASMGQVGVVKVLLEHNADVSVVNANGVNALSAVMFWVPNPPSPNDDAMTQKYRAIEALLRAHGAVPSGPVTLQPLNGLK
jgi:ankyrin repeat protein